MADRSVSAMRAMFEAKGENTSPPSRGRSPAGSERSNGSRNVSNMRSSFVAVEKSGMLGLRRVSDAEQPPDGVSPSHRGRDPLSRASSLTNVQEEDGGLGNILKGSPFEDSRKARPTPIPRSVPDVVDEKKNTHKKTQETQAAPVQKVAGLAQGTVNKYKSTAPVNDSKAAEQKPLSISTSKTAARDKNIPTSAKTPTSATRTGPSLKVSSPSTAAPASKPAPRKPTEPKEPKLSARPSRPSLVAGAAKETRAKSPAKPAPKPRVSEAAALRNKPSRTSLGNVDPDFLSRMSRPTQASASKTEKEAKADEKKPRQSMGKALDEGVLSRLTRPTQASTSKHQEEEAQQQASQPKATGTSSRVLERLMKPTQSSTGKHEKDVKPEESKKAARNSTGGKSTEPGFLERMSKPTAASLNKHHEKNASPVEEPKQATATPPRTKTQIAAAVMKPKQKLEAAKNKVEEKITGRPKSKVEDHAAPAASTTAAGVAPEQTQAAVEAKRPIYERVKTEKAEGVPHLSAVAANQAKEDEARAKRVAPVLAKEESREKALDAATPATEVPPPATNGDAEAGSAEPVKRTAEPALETTSKVSEPTVKNTDPAPAQIKETVPVVDTSKPAETKIEPTTISSPAEVVAKAEPVIDTSTATNPIELTQATDTKANAPTLKSHDTDIAPSSHAADAGAGEAPGPALNAGAAVVQEAKTEANEQHESREGEGLAEAVAKVH